MRNYFKAGTWNALCDVCGRKFKSDQMRARWDGLMVCKEDYEQRHPMDFLRLREENTAADWVRHPTDVFVDAPNCTVTSISSIAGYASAGCAVAGRALPTI